MVTNKRIHKSSTVCISLLSVLIAISISICPNSFAASQLSQFGITWTFDANYQTGQFTNGDYWVVGPVVIIGIDPISVSSGGRIDNGSMLNPIPDRVNSQGYDSAMIQEYGGNYSASLNVALNVSSGNPLVLQAGSSLVSSISNTPALGWAQLRTAAVLTVLTGPAPAGSFRPAYSGTDKTIKFNKNQLNYALLSNLTPVSGTPALSTIERNFERPWLDHVPYWVARALHPSDNMPDYGAYISQQIGDAALMLHLNFSNAQKETLLVRYVQLGIDLFGIVQAGGTYNWTNNGGHASARKWPILFAGLVLNDGDMMNIGRTDIPGYNYTSPEYVHFGEDDQTFYVSQADINSGRFPQSSLGLPEWGKVHTSDSSQDMAAWDDPYRVCCTATAWAGFVLSARIMETRGLWNHEALFDYQDRYMNTDTGWRQASAFAANMWDAYRANYGGIWPNSTPPDVEPPTPDTTPPSPPTNLSASNITSTSITLTWTASAQASDGDFASGYTIYRDGQSIATVNSTNYTDTSLTPETIYDYTVDSYDNANNPSDSDAANTFTTTVAGNGGNGQLPPPVISPILPPAPPTSGQAYYISPSGNDGNSGTSWTQAFRNLPPALQRGALYYFAGGTYPDYAFDDTAAGTQYIVLRKATLSDHGTDTGWTSTFANNKAVFGEIRFTGAYIYFDGVSPAQTELQWNNSGPQGGGSVLSFAAANHITVLSTDVNGNFQATGNTQTNGSCNVVSVQNCSYLTIINCQMRNAADDAFEIFSSNNLNISYNEVFNLHGCGTDLGCGPCYNGHSDGFEAFAVSDSEFVGNFVHNVPSDAAFFFGNWASSTSDYCRNILMANNIFYNNSETGFIMYIEQIDNLRLYNNTFWGRLAGTYGGLSIGRYVTNLEMYNNIILSIDYSHIGGGYNAAQHRGDNNFFGASLGQYGEKPNDIVGIDPGFVGINGANGPLIASVSREDFMLKESSVCIDSGTSVDLAIDIAGTTRPVGPAFDRGAFEFGESGPDTTPPQVTSVTFGETTLDIRFNEALENASATNLENYYITNDITINNATLNAQSNTVTLQTSPHTSNTSYEVTISSIRDIAGNTLVQGIFNYKFTRDIVGHWLFNEPTGSTPQDQSTFGNVALLINGATLNGIGQVLLDGVDAAIEISMANMSPAAGTVMLRAQQNLSEGVQYFFGHTVGQWTNNIQLYTDNGSLTVGLGDSHTTNQNIDQLISGQSYHLALTWNGSEYAVYINGLQRASGNYSGLNSLNAIADFGNDGNQSVRNESLSGLMDQARIYNYVLTANEILTLSGGSVEPPEPDTALVGHWLFDELTGNISQDQSGYGNNATLINGAIFTAEGNVLLDGIDDAIEISMTNMSPTAGTIVIMAQFIDLTGVKYLFGQSVGSWTNNIQLYADNGNLAVGMGDSHTTFTNIQLMDVGQFYQIALTWDSGQYNIYIDGVEKDSGSYTGLNATNNFADIGNNGSPDFRQEAFDGIIDQARIYNYALTSVQIQELLSPLDEDLSLIGHWQFAEDDSLTTADSSRYNNTGLLINGPAFTGYGKIRLDGDNDAIQIPTKDMNVANGTIAMWVLAESISGYNYLFGHAIGDWQEKIQLYIKDGTLSVGFGDNHQLATNIESIKTGDYYHIALSWDSTSFAVYVNGQEKISGNYTGLNVLNSFADIGNNGNPDFRTEAFAGFIKDARIYNRRLNSQEIATLANEFAYGMPMLNLIITNWLGYDPEVDIAPPGGDGVVDILDFLELSEHWKPQSGQ